MSDIVAELREAEAEGFYGHVGTEAAGEAADEIERLRTALKKILNASCGDEAVEIAWAALGEKSVESGPLGGKHESNQS